MQTLRITDYEEQNHMTAHALAVLFNPTLLRAPSNDFGELMSNMTHTSQLLQTLIIHVSASPPGKRINPDIVPLQFHRVFDETDVEQDDEIEEADVEENVAEDIGGDQAPSHRLSSVPTDAIHDHDPDLELIPSLQNPDPETM